MMKRPALTLLVLVANGSVMAEDIPDPAMRFWAQCIEIMGKNNSVAWATYYCPCLLERNYVERLGAAKEGDNYAKYEIEIIQSDCSEQAKNSVSDRDQVPKLLANDSERPLHATNSKPTDLVTASEHGEINAVKAGKQSAAHAFTISILALLSAAGWFAIIRPKALASPIQQGRRWAAWVGAAMIFALGQAIGTKFGAEQALVVVSALAGGGAAIAFVAGYLFDKWKRASARRAR